MDAQELQTLLGYGVTESGQEHRFVVVAKKHTLPEDGRRFVIYNFDVTLDEEVVHEIRSRYSESRKQHRTLRSTGEPDPPPLKQPANHRPLPPPTACALSGGNTPPRCRRQPTAVSQTMRRRASNSPFLAARTGVFTNPPFDTLDFPPVRAPPQTRTTLPKYGPDHLGLRCNAQTEHQTAKSPRVCAPFSSTGGAT